MQRVSEEFQQFFEPLVGDETRVSDLKVVLAEAVNTDLSGVDPYDRLLGGVTTVMDEVAFHSSHQPGEDKAGVGFTAGDAISISLNGQSAMKRTVAVVRAVGGIYTAKAKVPQHINRVQQSTNKTLLGLYGMAFHDRTVTALNLAAYQKGLNPRNRVSRFMLNNLFSVSTIIETMGTTDPHWSRRAFEAKKDKAGQLDIRPRFKPMVTEPTGRKCPATEARVGAPGEQRSALWVLMGAVGEVAVTEIFPRYFDIATE